MRWLVFAFVLLLSPGAARGQPAQTPDVASGALVMYVGPAPDISLRLSLGIADVQGGQVTISQRREMASGCAWVGASDLEVPAAEIIAVRDARSFRSAEEFGVMYATMYSALVSYRGGVPAPADHGCVRVLMTDLARTLRAPAK